MSYFGNAPRLNHQEITDIIHHFDKLKNYSDELAKEVKEIKKSENSIQLRPPEPEKNIFDKISEWLLDVIKKIQKIARVGHITRNM